MSLAGSPGVTWADSHAVPAHMYASVTDGTKLVRGEPSIYDVELSAELDEQMVAQVAERDPAVLAGLVEQRTAEFLSVARGRSGSDPVAAPPRSSDCWPLTITCTAPSSPR